MSRIIEKRDLCPDDFALGYRVSFNYGIERLVGKVVRAYRTREIYHIQVGGSIFEVGLSDAPQLVRRA